MKKIIGIVVVVFIIVMLAKGGDGDSNESKEIKGAEKTAVTYLENFYNGNVKKCTELLFDDEVEAIMGLYGYATKEVFIHNFEKKMDNYIEKQKDGYGKNWDVKIKVVDSYEIQAMEDYSEYEFFEVLCEEQHQGNQLLFFKTDDSRDTRIKLIKKGSNWYVFSFISSWWAFN